MKTYNLTYDYNLNINIEIQANNKDEAKELAETLILNKIDEMLNVGNHNEHEIEFQEGSLEDWCDDECDDE